MVPLNEPILLSDGDWVCEGYLNCDGGSCDGNYYRANTHWTDAHDGQIYPRYWMPLPPAPAVKPESKPEKEPRG